MSRSPFHIIQYASRLNGRATEERLRRAPTRQSKVTLARCMFDLVCGMKCFGHRLHIHSAPLKQKAKLQDISISLSPGMRLMQDSQRWGEGCWADLGCAMAYLEVAALWAGKLSALLSPQGKGSPTFDHRSGFAMLCSLCIPGKVGPNQNPNEAAKISPSPHPPPLLPCCAGCLGHPQRWKGHGCL